jgi:asparagine synthase (glutamine-hydrolysing)
MALCLAHRGPDDEGAWSDPTGQVGLGFRRLAIIDLSAEGHQPMSSADGRYTAVFNGEFYNFQALRKELLATGASFRGHSDTEVMLAAMTAWGVERAIPRLWGMFALALWDGAERRLHLVRDRVGKKPLYYGWSGDTFLFGSELKALRAHPAFRGEIDRDALAGFLRFSYVPAPRSIYRGIRKLPPGSWLTVDPGRPGEIAEPRRYWDLRNIATQGLADPLELDDAQAIDRAEELLADAVRLRAVADVPVGAFLSGGIDSSVVVALLQAGSTRQVATFTIGYDDDEYDESRHAAAIARHLGTHHTELRVTPQETLDVIPRLAESYDEPFADASQVPTSVVSMLARRHVTVALSGDGGDEVFGGYNRYVTGTRLWARSERVPRVIRQTTARGMELVPPAAWDRLGELVDRLLPTSRRGLLTGNNIHKLATVIGQPDIDAFYTRLVSTWPEPASLLVAGGEPALPWAHWLATGPPARRMMLLDLLTYLPDDILVKVDRASMSASLEARAPLLDHRLVEFCWRLPTHQLVRGGEGKWLLRRVLERHVPREMFERPKHGFGVPIDAWLRGPLREWACDLLSPDRLRREGYLRPEPIEAALWAHLDGRRNLQYQLWTVLMFEAWLERERSEGRSA